jgi:hypothetical protein
MQKEKGPNYELESEYLSNYDKRLKVDVVKQHLAKNYFLGKSYTFNFFEYEGFR